MNATIYYGLALLAISVAMWVAMINLEYFGRHTRWPIFARLVFWIIGASGAIIIAIGLVQAGLNLS